MIHLAAGLFIVSLTCAGMTVLGWLVPAAPQVDTTFATGSAVAVLTSGALLWHVRRERL